MLRTSSGGEIKSCSIPSSCWRAPPRRDVCLARRLKLRSPSTMFMQRKAGRQPKTRGNTNTASLESTHQRAEMLMT